MAQGLPVRSVVQDPNAPQGGNAPSQQLTVGGISTGQRGPAPQDTSAMDDAIASFGRIGDAMQRKKKSADFIEGRMASMSGKTQAEVAATGNRTTMAGFVSLEVTNAVANWQAAQAQAASTEHYNTDPAAYQAALSKSSADLISNMGGDEFAERALAQALAPAMERLSAAQTAQHADWTMNETANSYTQSLILSGKYAAGQYTGSDTGETPTTGAVNGNSDYMAVAEQFVGKIIGAESNNNANAQNTQSSAGGLGQFIDSTWISTVRKYKPSLAGKTNAEILAMKKGESTRALQREMTVAFAAENASGLAASGLAVNKGTVYLAHFAGLGGARRVLKGDPTALVSTTMTKGQIAANKTVMYRNGRMITNAELVAWAGRKMGGKSAPAGNVNTAIMTNPGLPPEIHRNAVTNAIVSTLTAGDGSLFQNAGGIAGLSGLNLSAVQMGQINRAHDAFETERQNEYNVSYERQSHNLLAMAATGNFSEEEMFEQLAELNSTFDRTDAEQRRMHVEMQKEIDGVDLGVWAEPDRQLDLMDIKQQVLNGELTAEAAVDAIKDIGDMYSSDTAMTEKAVGTIIQAFEAVKAKERAALSSTTKAGLKDAKTRQVAGNLVSRNILGTGTKAEQAAGILLVEEKLLADLQASDVPPEEMQSTASDLMAKVLVNNDVIDPNRSSAMRHAMLNPIGEDGNITQRAEDAMAFFMDLKLGAGATPEYLARMFAGNEKTLEMMLTAESHMVGDADMDLAVQNAWKQINDPITRARINDQRKRIESGEFRTAIKESIIKQSGLTDSVWNGTMNMFNNDWAATLLDEEGVGRIMADSGLDLVIDEETRSAVALYPNASMETITQIVTGQMGERGKVMGSSYVMAPKGSSVAEVMGLNSTEPNAANTAAVEYVTANGEEMFGKAVWADLGPSFYKYADVFFGDTLRGAGAGRPEFTVELIGPNFVITPASEKYAFDDDIIWDDYASLPEAASAVIPAAQIGSWYNEKQTQGRDGMVNTVLDWFRPNAIPQSEKDRINQSGLETRLETALPD